MRGTISGTSHLSMIAYHTSYKNSWTGKMPVPQKLFFIVGLAGKLILQSEQPTHNLTQKIKQKQQCDCHKPKHDFVNDIAPPLPKQSVLNLYLSESSPTLHRGDSRARHLAQ